MNVSINNDCTGCGLCESINSDVFTVAGGQAKVNGSKVSGNEKDCISAAEDCPVGAIKIS